MTYTKDITKCETNYQIKKVVFSFQKINSVLEESYLQLLSK